MLTAIATTAIATITSAQTAATNHTTRPTFLLAQPARSEPRSHLTLDPISDERLDQRIFTLVVVIAMLITGTTYICTSILDLQSTPYVAPARD